MGGVGGSGAWRRDAVERDWRFGVISGLGGMRFAGVVRDSDSDSSMKARSFSSSAFCERLHRGLSDSGEGGRCCGSYVSSVVKWVIIATLC